jgi:hypothetical protein
MFTKSNTYVVVISGMILLDTIIAIIAWYVTGSIHVTNTKEEVMGIHHIKTLACQKGR